MEKRHSYRQDVALQVRVTAMANPGLTVSGETLDISESGIGVASHSNELPAALSSWKLRKACYMDSLDRRV